MSLGAGPPAHAKPGRKIERVDVSEPSSISSGIAQRYATALFDLSLEAGALDALETDADALGTAIDDSDALRDLLTSPIYSRDETEQGIAAIAAKMGLQPLTGNTLQLMAQNRRLFVVPALIDALRAKIAEYKGEVTAEVITAKPLTALQTGKLTTALKATADQEIKLNVTVDEDIIGGLIVKMGSKMIDTSIRSRLNALKNTMKEVG